MMVAALLAWALPARAQELVADLSEHLVAITTGFAGTDVLLFGAVEDVAGGGPGDVVVVVRGPTRPETVRRKERAAGIWINTGEAVVFGAPSFYQVAATRPLDKVAAPEVRERHEIGIDSLHLGIEGGESAPHIEFRAGLVREMQRSGLYGRDLHVVRFLGNRLFRTRVYFPANVPVGTYSVEVFLLRDGQVVSAQTTPLLVSKVGVGADIYDFAQRRAAAYGMFAVVVAMAAGWLAAVMFRRA
jgi:uncharacterized protein (TIGR02186 family)